MCIRDRVKAREVAGQSVGHFIGKVAGGKPPYFNMKQYERNIPFQFVKVYFHNVRFLGYYFYLYLALHYRFGLV